MQWTTSVSIDVLVRRSMSNAARCVNASLNVCFSEPIDLGTRVVQTVCRMCVYFSLDKLYIVLITFQLALTNVCTLELLCIGMCRH